MEAQAKEALDLEENAGQSTWRYAQGLHVCVSAPSHSRTRTLSTPRLMAPPAWLQKEPLRWLLWWPFHCFFFFFIVLPFRNLLLHDILLCLPVSELPMNAIILPAFSCDLSPACTGNLHWGARWALFKAPFSDYTTNLHKQSWNGHWLSLSFWLL